MKALVNDVTAGSGATLEEIDISTDPALTERYGLEIPVLLIDGTKVAKYRVAERDLRRMLKARIGRPVD